LLEQVRDVRVAKQGADHPDTLRTLHHLASAYQAAGKLDAALPLFEQAARGIEQRRFQRQNAARIGIDFIEALEAAPQFDRAEAWRRKWLAVVQERAGAESLPYAGELVGLGGNLLEQQKWADAESVLREGLALREKLEPDAWTTFNARSLLGAALAG